MTEEEKVDVIETVDEEGNIISFKLFDVIEYEGKEYAMLLPIDEEDSDDPELVLMRLVTDGEEYAFETIDDEDEFNAVYDYIESLEEDEEE